MSDSMMPSTDELLDATVAVAVCAGGGSRRAIRWAACKLFPHAHRVLLIHVIPSVSSIPSPSGRRIPIEEMEKGLVDLYLQDVRLKAEEEVFFPLRKLCRAKNVETLVLEGRTTSDALLNYLSDSGIKNLVLGSSWTGWIRRLLKVPDVPSVVLKSAPSTCNVFVVLRRKLTLKFANQLGIGGASINMPVKKVSRKLLTQAERNGIFGKQIFSSSSEIHNAPEDNYKAFGVGGYLDSSTSSNEAQDNTTAGERKLGVNNWERPEALSKDALLTTFPSAVDVKGDAHFDFYLLALELQKTLAMYRKIREDLVHAKKKVELLSSECSAEVNRVRDAVEREKMVKGIAAEDMAKPLEVVKEAEHTRQLLARERLIKHQFENFAKRLSFDKPDAFDSLCSSSKSFHRYSKSEIEAATDNFSDAKKIGEGTYGCVYKCILDQIVVAVKVVRQDASDKKEEFLREVEVLSQLKHPHMVSLLGVCPESGCLVYEYMENGSLEDQLFYRKNSPPLPWFTRFRILFEVACALAFLHGNKPAPIVHRDVKPGNILLDKNYVSKVGDVGLARLVSDIVPDNVTEYKETMIAGTLYYMDPEYLRTGTVRPKSDLYALGIIALQLLTAKQTTCLVVQVENAIENGTLADILDKSIPDWPLVEAEKLAKLALRCSKLRCRDRPDLESEILPELEELLKMGNGFRWLKQCNVYSPNHCIFPNPPGKLDGLIQDSRMIR